MLEILPNHEPAADIILKTQELIVAKTDVIYSESGADSVITLGGLRVGTTYTNNVSSILAVYHLNDSGPTKTLIPAASRSLSNDVLTITGLLLDTNDNYLIYFRV